MPAPVTRSRLAISFDGLRLLLNELIERGHKPAAIMVSPNEKRDLKQELMARSKQHTKDAESADHDVGVIGFIHGIPIISHPHVPPGKCRIMDRDAIGDRSRDHIVR
jgi:hypothetical protein